MRNIVTVLCFLFFSSQGFAQGSFPSDNGLFNLNYLKGCVSTEIILQPSDTTGTPFICFDADLSDIASNNTCFGGPAQSAADFRNTYEEPGIYNILFLKQLSNSQVYDSITIEILEPSEPFVALSNCDDGLVVNLNSDEEIFDFYTIDFGDGSGVQQYPINAFPILYQYGDPTQEYSMELSGSFDNTGNSNCENIEITKTFIPDELGEQEGQINTLEILSENSFEIAFDLNPNQIYQLQIKQNQDGDFETVATFSDQASGSYIFEDRDLRDDFYCARIRAESLCNGDELLSNEVCTIQLTGEVQLGGNQLNWNDFSFENSELLKNGEVIHSGDAPFLDRGVLCGQLDEYQVRSIDPNDIEVVSLPLEIRSITGTPTIPISQIATNVLSNTELELTWEVPQGLQLDNYVIYKKRGLDEDYFKLDTVSTNSYTDIGNGFFERNFYYSVAYINRCGGVSPVRTVAPNILLELDQEESIIQFSWNSFTGFDSLLTEYVLVKYDDNMNVLEEYSRGDDTSFSEDIAQSDEQLTFYQVQARSESGLVAYSNLVRYKIPSIFFVPTGFTPNGDARNEEIKVLGKFIGEVEFSIYNRWGTLIFRSDSIEIGWDGYLTNRPAPEGTYSFTIRVRDEYGEEYFKSGVFNLIR